MAEFDKLTRMVQRQQNMSEPIPPFYIRTLSSLETSLNSALAKEKEAKKKMNASNARALTAMKQKVKKTAKEYEKELKQFQEVRRSDYYFSAVGLRLQSGSGSVRAPVHCFLRTTCRFGCPQGQKKQGGRRYRRRRRFRDCRERRKEHSVHG